MAVLFCSQVIGISNHNNRRKKHCLSEIDKQFDSTDFSDRKALNDIMRVTRGNFRLLNRLFTQLDQIMKINNLSLLSKEVVDAARENLSIGSV